MSIKHHAPDYTLLATILILVAVGIVMLTSASSVVSYEQFGSSNYLVNRQLLYGLLVGLVGLIVASRIDYHRWKKFALPLLIFTLVLLVLVFMPGIGYSFGGARRWILLGPTTFQPSELLKLTFIIYLATWLEKRGASIKDPSYGLVPFCVLLGSVALMIILQPDFGTMMVVISIAVVMYFVAGAPLKHMAWLLGGGFAALLLLIKVAGYRAARLTVFLNPELDPQGIGYHINQAFLAIGSGGFWGLGLGHSRQKYNYLPEATGDSIFAIIGEELGFFLSVLIIGLFVMVMYRGLLTARRAPDTYGKLLAAGITAWFVVQAFINIGAMVGLLPLTGIPLPFISYGSSALALSLTAVGVLINVSKQTSSV
ncbi:MAG: putative lipid II flippase FtsW [Patescibacteria group bacterium]|jgi:cell division protein FtsW